MRSPMPRHLATSLSAAAVALALALAGCAGPSPAVAPATGTASPQPTASSSATPTPSPALGGVEGSPEGVPYQPDDYDQHQWPGDTRETNPEPVDKRGERTITTTYSVSDGISLRDGWFRGGGLWSHIDGNVDVVEGEKSFVIHGWSPGFMYRHRIYDGGKPTDFWLGTKFGSPSIGSNGGNCDVFRGDPANDGDWAWVSPYLCSWDNIRGEDPEPKLTLRKATVVTDKKKAARILAQTCNANDGQRRCQYFNAGSGEALGEQDVVGSYVVNPKDSKGSKTVKWEDEEGTTNSIGVEIGAEVKIGEIFKAEIKSSYEHSWEWSHKFGEDTEFELEPKTVGWLEFAPNYLSSLGMWVVDTGSETMLVPDVSLKSPLENGGVLTLRSCPVAEWHQSTKKCDVQPDEEILES